ncbi:MAG: GAF domain-containing protein [Longimicrobiales bacterium]|nr:GAF domain-containing protein [Longimicrobiales bacterium]
MLEHLAIRANAIDEPEEVFSFALELICRTWGWNLGHAYVYADPDRDVLEPSGLWCGDDPSLEPFRRATEAADFADSVGLVGEAASSGEPVWWRDLPGQPGFIRAAPAAEVGLHTALAIPVLAGREATAVLEFFSTEDREPDEDLLRQAHAAGAILGRVVERRRAAAGLERGKDQMLRILESVPIPVAMTVPGSGECLFVNRAFERFAGRPKDEVLGRSIVELGLLPDPEARSNFIDRLEKGPSMQEMEMVSPTEGRRTLLATGRLVDWEGETRVVKAFVDITERREAEELAARRSRQIQKLLRRMLTTQDDERRRIARELHDQIGQEMTAIQLDLAAVLRGGTDDDMRRRLLLDATNVVEEVTNQLRSLSFDLHPTMIEELGLASALASYVSRRSGRAGCTAELDLQEVAAGDRTAVICFRIAQEAVTNTIRHASASRIRVSLMENGGRLVLEVEDDGKGFDPGDASLHMGIEIMRERAALVGGSIEIDTAEGQGTRVRATLPVTAGADDVE